MKTIIRDQGNAILVGIELQLEDRSRLEAIATAWGMNLSDFLSKYAYHDDPTLDVGTVRDFIHDWSSDRLYCAAEIVDGAFNGDFDSMHALSEVTSETQFRSRMKFWLAEDSAQIQALGVELTEAALRLDGRLTRSIANVINEVWAEAANSEVSR